MIKLKKIVAAALAATMCLGLSMTAFAARQYNGWASPHTMQSAGSDGIAQQGQYLGGNAGAWIDEVTDKNGVRLEWSPSVLTSQQLEGIKDEKAVRELFEKAGYEIKDDWDIVPILATSVNLDDGIGADGAYAWIQLRDLVDDGTAHDGYPITYKAGDVVPVLRETYRGSGTYDVLMVEMVERDGQLVGRVQVTSNGQAMVAVQVRNMSDGTTVRLTNTKTGESVYVNKDPNATGSTATSSNAAASSSPATSPKTGEF